MDSEELVEIDEDRHGSGLQFLLVRAKTRPTSFHWKKLYERRETCSLRIKRTEGFPSVSRHLQFYSGLLKTRLWC